MTEEPVEGDTLSALREEFISQVEELRSENARILEESSARISQLEHDNAALRAQFILSATTTPTSEPDPEPTPEERYQEEVSAHADRVKQFVRMVQ